MEETKVGVTAQIKNNLARKRGETDMNNIFYIIGVIVVVIFIAGFFGLR